MCVLALVTGLGIAGCRDFHLSTSGFDLGPNPASPGDVVVVTFVLNLIPTQRHTIRVFIDDSEQMSVTRTDAPPVPVVLEIGDATDLIAKYGVGTRLVYVRVTADDSGNSTSTRSAGLELRDGSGEQED
jgi:hypothetical protein